MSILVYSNDGKLISKPTLLACSTDADCAGKTTTVTSALTADQSNITAWPSDRTLRVVEGGSIANASALTINGPFECHPSHRAFVGTGAVTFGAGAVDKEYTAWTTGTNTTTITSELLTNSNNISALDVRVGAVEIGQSAAVVGYDTQANLYANLVPAEGTVAYVTNDSTASKNGTYRKVGATTAGPWTQSSYDRVALVEADIDTYLLDKVRTILLPANLTADQKIRISDGTLVADAAWNYSDFIDVEPGDYQARGYFTTVYAAAGYTAADVFVEGYTPPSSSYQTWNFTISNPAVKKIRISANDNNLANFYFSKLTQSYKKTLLIEGLGMEDVFYKGVDNLADINTSTAVNADTFLLSLDTTVTGHTESLTYVVDVPHSFSLGTLQASTKIRVTTGAASTDANWKATGFLPCYEGQILQYIGWQDTANGVALYDADQVWHSGAIPDLDTYPTDTNLNFRFLVPAGAKFLRVSSYTLGWATFAINQVNNTPITTWVENLVSGLINDYTLSRAVYVDKATGDDLNTGLAASPLATINAGIAKLVNGGGTVMVKEGDYYETLDIASLVYGDLCIRAYSTAHKVRIMGSDIITGFSKTTGQNLIYEAAFTGTIEVIGNNAAYGYRIFEDEVPSKLITDAERHSLQRSQQYRLPYTEIKQITDQGSLALNLAYLDALGTGVAGYWYDQTNHVIYVVNAAHGDVSASSIHTHARGWTTVSAASPSYNYASDLGLRGLQFFYGNGNNDLNLLDEDLNLKNFNKVTVWDCAAFGGLNSHFQDIGSRAEYHNVESGGAGRDGIGSSLYFLTPNGDRSKEVWGSYNNIWCHDCYDDGFSTHMNGSHSINNFLFEYNADTGLQNIGCTYCSLSNGVAQKNGKGIVINGSAVSTHSRWGTSGDLYNVLCDGNDVNFFCDADAPLTPATLNLYNCVERNATGSGYRADGQGIINLHNCKSTGTSTIKTGDGTINVFTDTPVA